MSKISQSTSLPPQVAQTTPSQEAAPLAQAEALQPLTQMAPAPVDASKGEVFQQQFGPQLASQHQEVPATDTALQSELKDSFPGLLKVTNDAKADAPKQMTFGDLRAGQIAHFHTSSGTHVQFESAQQISLERPDGRVDQIQITPGKDGQPDQATFTGPDGNTHTQSLPVSILFDDGTKLSLREGGHAGITKGTEFASINQGEISTNNRSLMKNNLYQSLHAQGHSLQDVLQEFKENESNLLAIAEKYGLQATNVFDFNAADMDLLFRDGTYMAVGQDGAWTDASQAKGLPQAVQDSMQESRLDQSLRQQQFWQQQMHSMIKQIMTLPEFDLSE